MNLWHHLELSRPPCMRAAFCGGSNLRLFLLRVSWLPSYRLATSVAHILRCANRFPVSVKVGQHEDSSADMRSAAICCRQRDRKRCVSESFQPAPDVGDPVTRTRRDILHSDETWTHGPDDTFTLEPKAALRTAQASSRAGGTDVLARA